IVTVFDKLIGWFEARMDIIRRTPPELSLPANVVEAIQRRASAPAIAAMPHDGCAPALQLKNVQKQYGALQVLKHIDLTVESGQVICLIGPSGSGKTSLIRTINGLEALDGGEVLLHGKPVLPAGCGRARAPGAPRLRHRIVL